MDDNGLTKWRSGLSEVAVGLAACQLVVALGVAILPPPQNSEGGPIAGLFYALYYAAPLALLGVGLHARARWIMALVGLLALVLVVLHSAPLFALQLPSQEFPWQWALAVVLSASSGLAEAIIFVVCIATAVPRLGSTRPRLDTRGA